MPEARRHRVSSQRFLPAFRLVAVALIAVYTTAFLWPEAQAAKKHEAPVAKKSQAAADSRASGTKNVAQSRGSKVEKVARADKADRAVRGGRNVVATIR